MTLQFNQSINRFRQRRGRVLHEQIQRTRAALGRDLVVLDVGGRADYWQNVGLDGIAKVILLNIGPEEFYPAPGLPAERFEQRIGDGCNLAEYGDGAFDLVHSNSVIEHVGPWDRISAMAREVRRVGRTGWIQTPAREFPIEPHFHLPFMHWLGSDVQAFSLRASPLEAYRKCSSEERRMVVDSIHLLSKREMDVLFPDCSIYVERIVLPKCYVARWGTLDS